MLTREGADRRVRRERETEQEAAERVTASLAGLAMALGLIVVSLYLTDHLHRLASVQDCLMSGRTNCMILSR